MMLLSLIEEVVYRVFTSTILDLNENLRFQTFLFSKEKYRGNLFIAIFLNFQYNISLKLIYE